MNFTLGCDCQTCSQFREDALLGARLRLLVDDTVHPKGWDSGGIIIQKIVRDDEPTFYVVYEPDGLYDEKSQTLDEAMRRATTDVTE